MSLVAAKVCVFDAYGTLFDLAGIPEAVRADLGGQADSLMRIWRRRQLEISWLPLRPGMTADFWRVTEEALDFAMDSMGLDDRGLRKRLMEAWLAPDLYPEVIAVLERLRKAGYLTAILSNGSVRMLESAVARELAGGLDAVLSAQSVARFKPDPLVYRLASTHFGVEPASVYFVSGNGWDITAAAAFGFQVVWIDRDRTPPEKSPQGVWKTVTDLTELPVTLGA